MLLPAIAHTLTLRDLSPDPRSVDISFLTSDHMGLEAREFVQQCMAAFDGVLRPMVLALKRLLHVRGLNNVYGGGLGAYTLTLLVTFFLRRCSLHLPDTNHRLLQERMYLAANEFEASSRWQQQQQQQQQHQQQQQQRSRRGGKGQQQQEQGAVGSWPQGRLQQQAHEQHQKEQTLLMRAEAAINMAVRLARPPATGERSPSDGAPPPPTQPPPHVALPRDEQRKSNSRSRTSSAGSSSTGSAGSAAAGSHHNPRSRSGTRERFSFANQNRVSSRGACATHAPASHESLRRRAYGSA